MTNQDDSDSNWVRYVTVTIFCEIANPNSQIQQSTLHIYSEYALSLALGTFQVSLDQVV